MGIYNLLLLATPRHWRHYNPRLHQTHPISPPAKTTQIAVINSIQAGHTTSIGVNYNEIFRLNGVSLNHTTLLAGLRTDVDSGSGSQADIAALQSEISTINTTLTTHDVSISELMILFTGFGAGVNSMMVRLNAVEAGVSTINTTLTAHDGRIFTNTADVFQLQTNGHTDQIASLQSTVSGFSSTISTIQSNSTFQSNSLGILTTRVNQQADSISGVMNDVDNLADTVSNFSSSIGLQHSQTL